LKGKHLLQHRAVYLFWNLFHDFTFLTPAPVDGIITLSPGLSHYSCSALLNVLGQSVGLYIVAKILVHGHIFSIYRTVSAGAEWCESRDTQIQVRNAVANPQTPGLLPGAARHFIYLRHRLRWP
jgi:hypothetical protein